MRAKLNQSSTQFIERLLNLIDQRFNLEEFITLCLLHGVSYENLRGDGKTDKTREFILFLGRRAQLPDLLNRLKSERSAVCVPRKKVQWGNFHQIKL